MVSLRVPRTYPLPRVANTYTQVGRLLGPAFAAPRHCGPWEFLPWVEACFLFSLSKQNRQLGDYLVILVREAASTRLHPSCPSWLAPQPVVIGVIAQSSTWLSLCKCGRSVQPPHWLLSRVVEPFLPTNSSCYGPSAHCGPLVLKED